jgi:hypothetical protein
MAIGAEAKQHNIEARKTVQTFLIRKKPSQRIFIILGGLFGIGDFSVEPINVFLGNKAGVEESLLCLKIIAVGIVWRDVTFVDRVARESRRRSTRG